MTTKEILDAKVLISRSFPGLSRGDFEVTSECTTLYNCIGWAASDPQNWWWPVGPYWPGHVLRDESLEAFVAAFATRGYERCEVAALDPNLEKVALYVHEQTNLVTHAARQLANGRWTSKLGKFWDITHALEGVCGREPAYGRVAGILCRARTR